MLSAAINPYKVGPPVTGLDFYGRNNLLRKVRDHLYSSNVVLLQGQRRIGKTSFLKRLALALKEEGTSPPTPLLSGEGSNHSPPFPAREGGPGGLGQFPVIFDIQRYIQDSLPQFQLHLAETIARELQLLSPPPLVEWDANPVLFQDTWLPQVYKYLGECNLVILVDEFDNLSEQVAPQAMETLVPFLGQLVEKETQIKWVFTLGRETGKLPIHYDPIISTGKQFRLSFLSKEETEQVIQQPAAGILTYQPEAVEQIYQLTSGQPHLTQALGSEIFQLLVLEEERNIVTPEDVEKVITQTLEAYSGTIASIVRVPILEERVLAAVAQLTEEGKTAKREAIIKLLVQNPVQIIRDELANTIASLLKWELLAGNEQAVQVSVELVRRWIVKHLSVEPSREESLDLNYALAQSRFEFAEKARKAGRYDLAIKDYKEALEVIPNHVETLRGLAEVYRITNKSSNRVKILQSLYRYYPSPSILSELITFVRECALNFERNKNYDMAMKQYEILIKLCKPDLDFIEKIYQNFILYSQEIIDKVKSNLDWWQEQDYNYNSNDYDYTATQILAEKRIIKLFEIKPNLENLIQKNDKFLPVFIQNLRRKNIERKIKNQKIKALIFLTVINFIYAKIFQTWEEYYQVTSFLQHEELSPEEEELLSKMSEKIAIIQIYLQDISIQNKLNKIDKQERYFITTIDELRENISQFSVFEKLEMMKIVCKSIVADSELIYLNFSKKQYIDYEEEPTEATYRIIKEEAEKIITIAEEALINLNK